MRTERLLNLLQLLRRHRNPVSGQALADALSISIRTVYRDIATLQSLGAEVEGEPGVGYVLAPSYFLPPLMLSEVEIEALTLGMRWVSTFADAPLAKGAHDALAKIEAVLPSELRNGIGAIPLRVGPPPSQEAEEEDLTQLREAIRNERKVVIVYRDRQGAERERTVWPFAVGYFADGRILVGWCELRGDFRHFRTGNIIRTTVLRERSPRRPSEMFRQWHASEMGKATPRSPRAVS
jgi:predicted DNA-binding transcriptional regulator YafY